MRECVDGKISQFSRISSKLATTRADIFRCPKRILSASTPGINNDNIRFFIFVIAFLASSTLCRETWKEGNSVWYRARDRHPLVNKRARIHNIGILQITPSIEQRTGRRDKTLIARKIFLVNSLSFFGGKMFQVVFVFHFTRDVARLRRKKF